MKTLYSSALHCNRKSFAVRRLFQGGIFSLPVFFFLLISIGLLFMACQKESARTPGEDSQAINRAAANAENDVVDKYTGLSWQTTWELQQARAATAKYRNIDNAIKDGYADIEVDVENMGHHFMKSAIVDSTFDIRQPEILVYNKNHDGEQELVAVEYAIPLSNPRPEGFTGSDDIWKDDSGF